MIQVLGRQTRRIRTGRAPGRCRRSDGPRGRNNIDRIFGHPRIGWGFRELSASGGGRIRCALLGEREKPYVTPEEGYGGCRVAPHVDATGPTSANARDQNESTPMEHVVTHIGRADISISSCDGKTAGKRRDKSPPKEKTDFGPITKGGRTLHAHYHRRPNCSATYRAFLSDPDV